MSCIGIGRNCLVAWIMGHAFASVLEAKDTSWPKADPQAVARWQEKRFGMFIHFGPVSLTGHEIGWSRGNETPAAEYDKLYLQFNPTNFNADAWARTARDAGMRYVVLTTKHHDGFCLWDTKFSDYNIMQTPFGRDIVKELAKACRKEGLAFGAYYSTCDWRHPDFPLMSPGGSIRREKSNIDAYNKYLLSQIEELITRYGPLITIWNDVPQEFENRGAQTIRLARSLQPDILINDRTGDGGDYDTPEQRIGKYQDARPWESCMTLCEQWSWKPGDRMKSVEECLTTLIRCVGGDGNLLFNVGPMPTGEIEPRQVERLREMGAWLKANGESIYGTRGGPWKPTSRLASTRRGSTVYLHLMKISGERIELPDLFRKVVRAEVLGGAPVSVSRKQGRLTIQLPKEVQKPIDTIVKLELDGPAGDLPALEIPSDVQAEASNTFRNQKDEYGPQFAFDGDRGTRWATDDGTHQAWISVEFKEPRTIRGVRVHEAYAGRVKQFELQHRDGTVWKKIFAGTVLGAGFEKDFPPVKAREFRLQILDASEGPTIEEVELF